ncbi:MAG TPA: hypothetical protein VK449_06855 [Anaerolineales bacterium]|nr:hypothetical protein [Anaerolineales bacterium]
MDQSVGLIVALLGLLAVLFGLFASAAALFPRQVWLAQRAAEESPGRSLIIGAVNAIFVVAVALALFSSQLPLLTVLGGLVAAAGLAGLALGWAGVTTLVGGRLTRQRNPLSQILTGTVVLTLASAVPFLGWFVVLPGLIFLGLGGFVLGWFRRRVWSADL